MKLTTIFKFKKPDFTDYVNVEDLNENMDILDETLGTHLDKDASTTQKGHVQLSDATNSTSIILAATANAVKKVWDLATGKYSKPTAGIPKTDLDNAVQNSLGKADSALQSVSKASTTVEGIVMLDDAVDSNSTTKAATANAVKKVKDSVSNVNNYGVATQAEAEAGSSNAKYMTPLRVKEAVTKFTPKDVPNGYAGLDENEKLKDSVIPNSIEKYVKIAEMDFSVNPATSAEFSNLRGYKKLLVKALGVKTNTTSNTSVALTYNGITANSSYNNKYFGSGGTVVSNQITYIPITVSSGSPIFNGEWEIDNENKHCITVFKNYIETLNNPQSTDLSIGISAMRFPQADNLNSLNFTHSSGFSDGKIEVWGVSR